jgi:mannonate dehydratase
MLTRDNLVFAKQVGATHIVAHLVDYFREGPRIPGTVTEGRGWGETPNRGRLWTFEELRDLRAMVNAEGLELAAIENFDPAHWYDILLDGPNRAAQLEDMKTIIRRVGQAGIPCIGYNFSIAGVWGHVVGPFARGRAESVGFLGADGPRETPIPRGMVWNMVYDPEAPEGSVGTVTPDQLWHRLAGFLEAVVPVAEEAGVRLALHPDDPPMPALRDTARLVYQPGLYQRVLDIKPSYCNGLEFCVGSIAEMTEGDVYDAIDRHSRQGSICYVHFRNVRGRVPHYTEVFIDEGDVDMLRVLRILKRNRFTGVLIPDHTPQVACAAPWHAGMAFALGYMRAGLNAVEAT